jgi:MSHA biogenesis protein MshJ
VKLDMKLTLPPQLAQLATRVDSLSMRERVILLLVLLIVPWMAIDTLLIVPNQLEQQRIQGQIATTRQENQRINEQIIDILNKHNQDPDIANRQLEAQLKSVLTRIEGEIDRIVNGLIDPRQMAQAIEAVLKRQQGLRLIAVESLGSERVHLGEAHPEAAAGRGVFRHSMRIEFEGSYLETLEYLRALEALPWAFRWDAIQIEMRDYPRAHIRLQTHTLSLENAWIGT